jgi:hypothetical protein
VQILKAPVASNIVQDGGPFVHDDHRLLGAASGGDP